MANKFLELAFTESVRKAQEPLFGHSQRVLGAAERDPLTDEEIAFIQARDSFYMATVTATGWPYHAAPWRRAGFSQGNQSVLACLRGLQR